MRLAVERDHRTERAVHVFPLLAVLREHHRRPDFELERFRREASFPQGLGERLRSALGHGERDRLLGQSCERDVVDAVDIYVVREEFRHAFPQRFLVHAFPPFDVADMDIGHRAATDRGEHREEIRIVLPILFGKVADRESERLPRVRLEREDRPRKFLVACEQGSIGRHRSLPDRRELEEIPDADDLESAERIDRITHVAAHAVEEREDPPVEHRDLVDDEHLRLPDPLRVVRRLADVPHVLARELVLDADAAPRMDREPADMRRRDAGRGGDRRLDAALAEKPHIPVDGMRLPGARFPREEHVRARLQYGECLILRHARKR